MKNKMFHDVILYIIYGGIIVSSVVLYYYKKPVKIVVVDLSENSEYIYIPVIMDNGVYSFLFDTAADLNAIDFGLAQKIGISVDTTAFSKITLINKIRYDTLAFAKKDISIGKMNLNGIFALNGYKGLVHYNNELIPRLGAVMGMGLIQQFNWLFNFDENTATLSKDRITIPTLPDDQILTLDYSNCESGITCIDLIVNGMTIQNVHFDTGLNCSIDIWNKVKSADIVFTKPDFETLTNDFRGKQQGAVCFDISDNEKASIIDSLKINNFTMQGILVLEEKDNFQTLITIHFVRRFRMMYFDSKNSQIHLYVSPADSTRHNRRDLQNFSRALLPFLTGYENEIPYNLTNVSHLHNPIVCLMIEKDFDDLMELLMRRPETANWIENIIENHYKQAS